MADVLRLKVTLNDVESSNYAVAVATSVCPRITTIAISLALPHLMAASHCRTNTEHPSAIDIDKTPAQYATRNSHATHILSYAMGVTSLHRAFKKTALLIEPLFYPRPHVRLSGGPGRKNRKAPQDCGIQLPCCLR